MRIKEFFQKKEWQKWNKSQWTIVILTGVLLMILAIPVEKGRQEELREKVSTEEKVDSAVERGDYATELEIRLENALSKIEGAGLVEVMITLEDSGESVVEKDDTKDNVDLQEMDSAGGSRHEINRQIEETTIYKEENNEKIPFVGKEKTPKIAGILVVAQGGENTVVKQNIYEAVMALFQIDVNRIKVVKMNIQEEGY